VILSAGGKGRGRQSRPSDAGVALLMRLRRLEVLVLALYGQKSVKKIGDKHLKAMLEVVADAWNQNGGEALRLPQTSATDRETEGDNGTDG